MDLKGFLQMIAGPGGTIHIRTQSVVDDSIQEYWLKPDEYEPESLEEAFGQKSLDEQRNMWFQVSTVNDHSKTPVGANVVWADIDLYKYPGGETQAMGLMRYLPTPSVVVRSGRGLHVYWKLKETISAAGPMSAAQILAKSAQWFLGSDPAHSPSKLLRIPGTLNFKPNDYEGGKPCEIIRVNDVVYDPKDFPIDEVLMRVGHKLMTKIMLGPDEAGTDRSEFDYATVAQLLQNGFSQAEVEYLLKTYPFSGKVGSEPANRDNYVARTVKSAMFKVQVSGLNAPKPPKDPVAWVGKTLTEILAEEKPPFVVDEFLPATGVAMIAAPPKARKSWSVMQLAHAVANGTQWLGFNVPEPKKVLYIQAELPNWQVASRMTQMFGDDPLPNVAFFHTYGANLMEDDDLQGLLDAIQSYGAELVIIDPVANFWQGDENSSSSVNAFFDQITKIQKLNCAVVLVHHARKTDVNERLSPQHQRGSNVWFARPDAIMTLSPTIAPGEVPYTWADFALRAAEPKEPLKLYTDSTGKFTIDPPSLGAAGSPVKQFLLAQLAAKKQGDQGNTPGVIMFQE